MKNFLHNKTAVVVAAGILLGLSFPPVNLPLFTFPAFMLLFHLADTAKDNRELIRYSYFGFIIWNAITTYWLMMASSIAGIAAILANSILMCLPLIFARSVSHRLRSPVFIALLQAAAWTGYEYLHHHWDLAWPWLAIGNAWADHAAVIQYISVTGHLGISFWVVFTAALAYKALQMRRLPLAYAAAAVLLTLPVISLLMYASEEKKENTPHTEVAVIQPNHDSYLAYGGMSGLREVEDSLFALTERTLTPETRLVVWPENAIDSQIFINSATAWRIADFSKTHNTAFIAGTGLIEVYDTPPAIYRGYTGGKAYNIFNAALYADENGKLSYYNKANLVPIVERVPFLNALAAADIFNLVDWGKIGGFGKGTEATTLQEPEFITGGLVCYDSVYPAWIRKFVNQGPGFITIITNDGWWGNTSGHHQHFAYARLRALEFNRWVVRSANNGISGIIDNKGRVKVKTDYWVRTGFTYEVPVLENATFYARYGDWLSWLCLAAVLLFWGRMLAEKRRKPTAT